jgi:hypothetical protein
MTNISRRNFLRSAAGSAAGLMAANTLFALLENGCHTPCDTVRPENTDPRRYRRVFADLHLHPTINKWIEKSPLGVRNNLLGAVASGFANTTDVSWKSSYEAGIDLLCSYHYNVFDEWLSMPSDPTPDAPSNILRSIDMLENELSDPAISRYVRLAKNKHEFDKFINIPRDSADWRTTLIHAIEGGHALGYKLENLEIFA